MRASLIRFASRKIVRVGPNQGLQPAAIRSNGNVQNVKGAVPRAHPVWKRKKKNTDEAAGFTNHTFCPVISNPDG